jgi:hypothetical protein
MWGVVQLRGVVEDQLDRAGLAASLGAGAVGLEDGLVRDSVTVEEAVGGLEISPGFGLVRGGAVGPGGDLCGEAAETLVAASVAEVAGGELLARPSVRIEEASSQRELLRGRSWRWG